LPVDDAVRIRTTEHGVAALRAEALCQVVLGTIPPPVACREAAPSAERRGVAIGDATGSGTTHASPTIREAEHAARQ
jgi:hypothetical protein